MTESCPTAAVLIIGDEVLSGRTQDTNLNTIARFLAALGIDLIEARTIGDRKAQIVDSLNALRAAHDYVFTTGGIGPTHDDITADAVATAFGVPLPEHPEALAILARRYGADFNAARRRMARIPEGGTLIANPVTDAPGFQIGNVFVMAGVPKIMAAMLEDVAPRLRTGAVVHARTIKVTGVGEGAIADLLTAAAARAERELGFGSYPFGHGSVGEMGTNLVVRGRDAARVEAAVEGLLAELAEAGVAAVLSGWARHGMIEAMDDAASILTAKNSLDAAVESMDEHEGFAILHHKGREIILMSSEKFEQWEDAVDKARLIDAAANPDAETISMEELRAKYQIPPGVG